MKAGKFNETFNFTLKDINEKEEEIEVKYKGTYVIVDNGYQNWSVLIPPIKKTTFTSEIRFSEWLESLQRDVDVIGPCQKDVIVGRVFYVIYSNVYVHYYHVVPTIPPHDFYLGTPLVGITVESVGRMIAPIIHP